MIRKILSRFLGFLVSCLWLFAVGCGIAEQPPLITEHPEQPLMTGALKSRDDVEAMFSEPIFQQLVSGKRNLVQWANELEKTVPTTPKELWTKYEVCLRAGRDETVIQLLPVLRDLLESAPIPTYSGEMFPNFSLYNRVHQPIRELQRDNVELLTAFFDAFGPVYCYDPPTDTFRRAGWSDEKIGNWLRKNFDAAVAYRPIRTNWSWGTFEHADSSPYISDAARVWQEQYMMHLAEYFDMRTPGPTAENYKHTLAEWNRLATDAEMHPEDMAKLSLFFSTRYYYEGWFAVRPKLDWLAETLDKWNGFESWFIARELSRASGLHYLPYNQKIRTDYLELSVPFWQRALDLSLTDEQCKQIHEENSRFPMSSRPMLSGELPVPQNDELTRAKFRVKIYDALNVTLLALNRAEETQAVMEEGRQFRKEFGLEGSADLVLAGMTQAASGYRVVEADILSREPTAEEIAESEFVKQALYWMERANYYRGRKELEQREDALRRGFALCTTEERRGQHHFNRFCSALLELYQETERKEDAVKLFHEVVALLGDEKRSPIDFYGPCIRSLHHFGEAEVIYPLWRQDVEKCLARTKEQQMDAGKITLELNWLMGATEVRNRPVFKFDNTDPLWWELLPLMREFRSKLLEILVLHVDEFYNSSRRVTFDEKAYEKAKTILLNEKNDAGGLKDLAWILLQNKQEKYALPLFETALERAKEKTDQQLMRSLLFQTLMELDEWRRAEKVFEDYLAGGSSDTDYILRCFESLWQAEIKAGATQDAQRFQKRLDNLGVR